MDSINISSVISSRDGRPFVQLKWSGDGCQLTPDEARQHAYRILDAANAAETDSIMVRFLQERVGIDFKSIVPILRDFREFRERKYEAADGQNRSGGI